MTNCSLEGRERSHPNTNNKLSIYFHSSVIQVYKRDGTLQTIDSFPRNCYYFGQVDGEPESSVAVSLCGDEMVQ